MNRGRISVGQMVVLLYISRVFTAMTFAPQYTKDANASAALLGIAISVLADCIVLIPAFLLYRRMRRGNVIDACYNTLGRGGGVVYAVFYSLFFFFAALSTLNQFTFFMSSAIFPNTSVIYLLITFLAVVLYASYLGIEGLARFSTLVFVGFLIALAFILTALAASNNMQTLYLRGLLYNGWKPLFGAISQNITRNLELVALLFIAPIAKGNKTAGYIVWLLLFSATFEIIAFIILSTLGDYATLQLFPFYTSSIVAEFSIFERLDALHMGIWVFMATVKTVFYVLLTRRCLVYLIPAKAKKFVPAGICVLLGVIGFVFATNLELLNTLHYIEISGIPIGLGLLLLPLLVLLVHAAKKGRRKRSASAQPETLQKGREQPQ